MDANAHDNNEDWNNHDVNDEIKDNADVLHYEEMGAGQRVLLRLSKIP